MEPIILLWDAVFVPKGIERTPEEQEKVDQKSQSLFLYQFQSCPFCIKVRREMKRLSLNIELLDAQYNEQHKKELLAGGGQVKVPCLKIVKADNDIVWMYESSDIIAYLKEHFSA